MHISEGVLSIPVLSGGWICTIALLIVSLRRISYECLPAMAVFASVFFLASLVRVPIGPTSAHFALLGLLGIILGWGAFPAICISLALQAILFQFGGLIALGVNSIIMGLPALLVSYLIEITQRTSTSHTIKLYAFIAGFGAILLATTLVFLALILSNKHLEGMALVLFTANIPLAILEGIITVLAVLFLQKVASDILYPTTCSTSSYHNEA